LHSATIVCTGNVLPSLPDLATDIKRQSRYPESEWAI
jgi:hypothetical protein